MGLPGWAIALRLTGLGWYVVVCVVGGTVAGIALDDWLNTKPIFVLGGLLLGIAVASLGIYRMLAPMLSGSQTTKKTNNEGRKD